MAKYVELEEYGKELAESFQISRKDWSLKSAPIQKKVLSHISALILMEKAVVLVLKTVNRLMS